MVYIICIIFPSGSLNNASLLPPNDNEESLDSEGICVCHGCNKMGTFLSSQDLVKMTDKELEVLLEMLLNDFQKISSCEKVQLVLNMLKCVIQWQWGTTNNFLYEWSSNIPDDVYKKEFLSLIDAGLEINSAYPLMLPPNRKVDLMLSFDYSETEPFSTLKSTDEYCKRNGIPFPEIRIDDAESEAPSHSCYMFEAHGTGAPPVLHFPLFNNQNCADKVQEFRKKYATINISYDELQLRELLTLTKQNVQLNKNLILEKFKQVSKCNS
ncbi:hypothetical protein GDO81_001952 [Engystomops pustulosus]|uniref:PLA2c domain-containing protein n=1 Tax=Engystomops pustulosus TaxID=76066 RepID=A0AAV7DG91_ENGPU|nr:hypothetical protein GDO81_001952 [Engystomops pustulosus]